MCDALVGSVVCVVSSW